jgi:hypothetical protein
MERLGSSNLEGIGPMSEHLSNGLCRRIIALRKLDASEREEAEALLDTYARALGMRPQLELFDEEK